MTQLLHLALLEEIDHLLEKNTLIKGIDVLLSATTNKSRLICVKQDQWSMICVKQC